MLLKTLQLTVRNLRGISRVISAETFPSIQSQSYAKWAARKPAAIVNEDELFDIEENTTPQPPKKIRSRSRKSKADEIQKENIASEVKFETEEDEQVKDQKSVYTKLYENEKLVS